MAPKFLAVFALLHLLTAWGAKATDEEEKLLELSQLVELAQLLAERPAQLLELEDRRLSRYRRHLEKKINDIQGEINDIKAKYQAKLPWEAELTCDMINVKGLMQSLVFWKRVQSDIESYLWRETACPSDSDLEKEKQRLIAHKDALEQHLEALEQELDSFSGIYMRQRLAQRHLDSPGIYTLEQELDSFLPNEPKSNIGAVATIGASALLLSIFAIVISRWLLHTQTKLTVKKGSF